MVRGRVSRVGLAALMALLAINVWTGGPLLALWIGSRVQSHSKTSMTIEPITAVVVFFALAAISIALIKSLSVVSSAYDRAAGVAPGTRRHDSWVSVERRAYDRPTLTVLDRILVVVVVIAALVFEIWFYFFSTSPIDGRSGRSAVPIAYQLPPPGRRT